MIDPCELPSTGWGWLALVTVSLTLLGLGVAFVALPRRSWMALVGAAAMAVVGIGGAGSVDAQTEECHSVQVINGGSRALNESFEWTDQANVAPMLVCEFGGTYVPGSVSGPAGLSGPTENCVEFPAGTAIGAVTYLVLSSAESSIVAVQDNENLTGIGLWTSQPVGTELSSFTEAVSSYVGCGAPGYSVPPHVVGNGDVVWVGSMTDC